MICLFLVYIDWKIIMIFFYFSEKSHESNNTVIHNNIRHKFSLWQHRRVLKHFRSINEIEDYSEITHLKGYRTEVFHYTNIYISRYFITTEERKNHFKAAFALGPTYRVMSNVRGIQIDQFANKLKQNAYPSVKKELLYGTNNNWSIKPYSNQYTTDVYIPIVIIQDMSLLKMWWFLSSTISLLAAYTILN